jgi:dTDP-4-amino-4,6-dideoxygalactose transaminase
METELVAVFSDALRSARFIGGPAVEQFETNFAAFCTTRFCVGVASGTDALRFALIAAGVKPGDGVITVPNTFAATVEAILQAGASPAFVDVDEKTCNMDIERLAHYLETRCKVEKSTSRLVHRESGRPVTAVLPVHLYGQMADMDAILDLAEQYNLLVIEDACQAHGAEHFSRRENRWKKAGSLGDAAAFSFYPGKNLGGCGDGGAVVTNDEDIVRTVRMLREHGQAEKHCHNINGYTGRLDAIVAGVLDVKLAHLEKWNEARRRHADHYRRLLGGTESVRTPDEVPWARSVYHLYVIRSARRDALQQHLNARGVATGLHYPIPLHLQKAYRSLGYKQGDFPVSERLAKEILSLPMYPELNPKQTARVAEEVIHFSESQTGPATEAPGPTGQEHRGSASLPI